MERIKDVQLRGQGDDAKIFVTIERCFKRFDHKWGGLRKHHDAQMYTGQNWRDAFMTEERNLVFLKERTADELDALKAGNMAPVKYIQRAYITLLSEPPTNLSKLLPKPPSPIPLPQTAHSYSASPPSPSTPISSTSIPTTPAMSKATVTCWSMAHCP